MQKFKSKEKEDHYRKCIQQTNTLKRARSLQSESPSIRYRETASYNPISNEWILQNPASAQSRRHLSGTRSVCGRRILEQQVIQNLRKQRTEEYRDHRRHLKHLAQMLPCMIPVKTNFNIISNEELSREVKVHTTTACEKLTR